MEYVKCNTRYKYIPLSTICQQRWGYIWGNGQQASPSNYGCLLRFTGWII